MVVDDSMHASICRTRGSRATPLVGHRIAVRASSARSHGAAKRIRRSSIASRTGPARSVAKMFWAWAEPGRIVTTFSFPGDDSASSLDTWATGSSLLATKSFGSSPSPSTVVFGESRIS